MDSLIAYTYLFRYVYMYTFVAIDIRDSCRMQYGYGESRWEFGYASHTEPRTLWRFRFKCTIHKALHSLTQRRMPIATLTVEDRAPCHSREMHSRSLPKSFVLLANLLAVSG